MAGAQACQSKGRARACSEARNPNLGRREHLIIIALRHEESACSLMEGGQMSKFFGFVLAACLLAIWTLDCRAANPDWPKSLTLATASPGGVFYVYGEAVAKIQPKA